MKKLLLNVFTIFICGLVVVSPVFADTKCVLTTTLGNYACDKDGNKIREIKDNPLKENEYSCSCDDGKGGSIIHILELVIDIMTIGIGVLATIGLGISGIQYLTAGGSEEQTRKAKRRIFEIAIGLAAYVLIYSLLKFILPNFQ